MSDKVNQFWNEYAQAYAHPLLHNELLSRFTSNTAVTGAYAESWIWKLASEMLPRFKVSTGCIIHASDRARGRGDQPQIDLIIWDPSELPAIFECGNFALVPSFSVRGVIEVKRSCNDLKKFESQIINQRNEIPAKYQKYILGILVKHHINLFPDKPFPKWCDEFDTTCAPPITRILDNQGQVDRDGVFALIYLLSQISGH
jgi:hypothetical protein